MTESRLLQAKIVFLIFAACVFVGMGFKRLSENNYKYRTIRLNYSGQQLGSMCEKFWKKSLHSIYQAQNECLVEIRKRLGVIQVVAQDEDLRACAVENFYGREMSKPLVEQCEQRLRQDALKRTPNKGKI